MLSPPINLPNLFVIKNETGIHNLPSKPIFNVYNMENQEGINQISEGKFYIVSKKTRCHMSYNVPSFPKA